MSDELKTSAKAVFDALCRAMDADGWKYEADEDALSVHTAAKGDDLPVEIFIRIDEQRQIFYLRSPLVSIPEGKRAEAARLICAMNYKIVRGCFDFDESDGELAFRLTTSFRGSILGAEVFTDLLMCACLTVDRYNDSVALYALGALSFDDFLAKIED